MATHRLAKSPSAPPVPVGGGQPEEAEVAHLADDVDREVVVAVPLRGVRRDLLLREVAHRTPELLVVLGQPEAHAGHGNPAQLTIANTGRRQVLPRRLDSLG